MGTGVKLNKHFSVGINMTVLSGQITRVNQLAFADYGNVFNDNSTEKIKLGGVNFDYGIQYTLDLKKNYFFNAGVSLTSPKYYNASFDKLTTRFTAYGNNDTINNISDYKSETFIPGTLRLGIAFGKKNKLTAGIDFTATNWSKSKIPGGDAYAADTKSLLVGLEYIPDKFSNYSFVKRLEYRIGGHIENNYLILDGKQVKELGATAGLGVPLRRSQSKANLFFDFTRRDGSSLSTPHTENYYTLGISLNLYDWWFIKRKYE
jgi:hypothetical protein